MTERYSTCVYYNKDTGCDKGIFSCEFSCLYKCHVKITYSTYTTEDVDKIHYNVDDEY